MLIEHWALADALFMSVVILSTVGLEAPHPLSPGGRAFTIFLIVTGVSLAAYVLSALGEYVTGGVFTGVFGRRGLARAVDHLASHYIVCGHGRAGRQIVEDLRRRGCAVVIIESAEVDVEEESNQDLTILSGDASDDAVLTRAGVSRAKGLVAATGSDATNLVIVLSARALAPDLVIMRAPVIHPPRPSSFAPARLTSSPHTPSADIAWSPSSCLLGSPRFSTPSCMPKSSTSGST